MAGAPRDWRGPSRAGRAAHAHRLHRRGGRHHPSHRHGLHPPRDCPGGRGAGGSPRHRAPHARRSRRLDARHQHRHHPVEDAGRGLRIASRKPRRVGGLSHHHCRRRRGDGSRHSHRRRASGVWRRPEGRRHDVQEDDVGRRGIRPHDRHPTQAQRRAGRAGRHREPHVHRTGSGDGRSAAHRRHRHRPAGPSEEARRPDDPPIRRRQSDPAHDWRRAAGDRDDVGAEES